MFFYQGVGLGEYAPLFLNEGYDVLEVIAELDDQVGSLSYALQGNEFSLGFFSIALPKW